MAFTIGAIAAKDGASTTIGGGMLAADVAGSGVGPWFLFQGLVDGVAGSNKAQVTAGNALKVDNSGVTQPVSLAAGATSIGKAEDTASADADVGIGALAVRKATPANTSGADGDYEFLQMSAGRLWTDSNIRFAGTTPDLGSGTGGSATMRVFIDTACQTAAVANNADAVAESASLLYTPTFSYLAGYNGTTYDRLRVDASKNLKATLDSIFTDDAAFTPATSKVNVAGFQADEASTDSVDEGDAGAARMTLDRKQIVTNQPHTKGGLLTFCSLDIDETEEDVKTSAGQLYGFHAANRTTSPLYLRFYNATAASVTVGTTATFAGPYEIPANASDHTVEIVGFGGLGVEFDTAISVSATTGFAANDTGAPATNACIVNVLYK